MAKRFIAGAVCPQCNQQDKLYIEAHNSQPTCAACGYKMTQPEENNEKTDTSQLDQAVTLVNFKNK